MLGRLVVRLRSESMQSNDGIPVQFQLLEPIASSQSIEAYNFFSSTNNRQHQHHPPADKGVSKQHPTPAPPTPSRSRHGVSSPGSCRPPRRQGRAVAPAQASSGTAQPDLRAHPRSRDAIYAHNVRNAMQTGPLASLSSDPRRNPTRLLLSP
jgi:hypothetical protein